MWETQRISAGTHIWSPVLRTRQTWRTWRTPAHPAGPAGPAHLAGAGRHLLGTRTCDRQALRWKKLSAEFKYQTHSGTKHSVQRPKISKKEKNLSHGKHALATRVSCINRLLLRWLFMRDFYGRTTRERTCRSSSRSRWNRKITDAARNRTKFSETQRQPGKKKPKANERWHTEAVKNIMIMSTDAKW